MANIKIKIKSPSFINAIITKELIEKLDLKPGDTVSAIIKFTEVMVAKEIRFYVKLTISFFI